MEKVTLSDLHGLVSARNENCLSLLMPTHPTGREGQQDTVRLKNLVNKAETELLERGVRTAMVRKIVEPILELPLNKRQWAARRQGLAVFRSEEVFESYWVAIRLEESLIVDERFHVKRLLPALNSYPPFFVLVLSRSHLRLLRGTWYGCESVLPRDVPTNMVEALNLQTADRGEQVHSARRGNLGKEGAVFHGQGGHRDTLKEEIAEYFQLVEHAIQPVVRDSNWPLILAGVDYESAIFRDVAAHLPIDEETLDGSFDYTSDEEIYQRSLPLARKNYAHVKSHALDTLVDFAHTGRASYEVEKIVPAAHQGQVETLFVNPQAAEYGRFRPETNWVEFTSERRPELDLVEEATEQTILHRGTVYAAIPAELPDDCAMGAVFRF